MTVDAGHNLTESSGQADGLTGNLWLDVGMLFMAGFCGPIFFWLPASTELLCSAFGLHGFSPVLAGLSCSSGQCSLFVLLFLFGERISAQCKCLRRRVDALHFKHRRLFERSSFAMTLGAGAIGMPPTVPFFILAPSLNMRLAPMLAVVFPFRFLRFAACCAIAGGLLVLPSTLQLAGTPRRIVQPHPSVGSFFTPAPVDSLIANNATLMVD